MVLNYLCIQMKNFFYKIILFFSLVAFLIASNGIFFINHYCHSSETRSTHFITRHSGNCCEDIDNCCTEEKSHYNKGACCPRDHQKPLHDVGIVNEKCCQDQNYFLKVFNSFLLPDNSLPWFQFCLFTNQIFEKFVFTPYSCEFISCNSPPPEINIPVFLKNNIFRL